jgi:hypothetical protein
LNGHFEYFWEKSEEKQKILLALLALLHQKKDGAISEEAIKKLDIGYENDLLELRHRSLILKKQDGYQLLSQMFTQWILRELADIPQANTQSLQSWLNTYQKSFLAKGLTKVEDEFRKVNPKYWDLLRETLLLVRNPQAILDIIRTIF